MITIDGAMGEGGGQVLRSSLTLSILTGQPFVIEGIRANRPRPGLRRQHLAATRAAREICGGGLEGDAVDSRRLAFSPGPVRPGHYQFDIGSAGSTTLVLQTILLPLCLADGPSTVTVTGGTHNPMAPPFEFLERVFAADLKVLGLNVALKLDRHGFYPGGGGKIRLQVEPRTAGEPLHLLERGEIRRTSATSVIADLPDHVADRELKNLKQLLRLDHDRLHTVRLNKVGIANVLMVEVESASGTEVFTAFGSRGVRAEDVARTLAKEVEAYLATGAPVSEHHADQLILPLIFAGGGSFVTGPLSRHATTNLDVVRAFTNTSMDVSELPNGTYKLTSPGL